MVGRSNRIDLEAAILLNVELDEFCVVQNNVRITNGGRI